jgi:hypothetical protein
MSVVTTVKSWTAKLTGFGDALAELHGTTHALDHRLEELTAEAAQLRAAPSGPDVLKQTIPAGIEALGAQWRAEHGSTWLNAFSEKIADDGGVRPSGWPDSMSLNMMGVHPPSLAFLGAIAKDLVTHAVLESATVALHGQEPGPSTAARQRRLAEIADETARLKLEHAQLVDEAERHGVRLAHLPEEQARRLRIRATHEPWERDGLVNRDYYARHPEKRPPGAAGSRVDGMTTADRMLTTAAQAGWPAALGRDEDEAEDDAG